MTRITDLIIKIATQQNVLETMAQHSSLVVAKIRFESIAQNELIELLSPRASLLKFHLPFVINVPRHVKAFGKLKRFPRREHVLIAHGYLGK